MVMGAAVAAAAETAVLPNLPPEVTGCVWASELCFLVVVVTVGDFVGVAAVAGCFGFFFCCALAAAAVTFFSSTTTGP
jgi:hypothetical protein